MALGQEGDWLRPETVSGAEPTSSAHGPALFELRPLSLGEVLDRTFALYRSRFWLFAGISMVSASVHVAVEAVSLATAHVILRNAGLGGARQPRPFNVHYLVVTEFRSWIAALLFFLVVAITQAATSLALSEVYMNRPASAKAALLIALKRWYRWIGIALWQAWSMLWIFLAVLIPAMVMIGFGGRAHNSALVVIGGVLAFLGFLGGLPAGFVLYLRNALAVPAAMVERLKIRAAMRRSKALAAGTKGRIFVVLLIAGVLYWVVAALESPAALLMMFAPREQHHIAQAITLIVAFVGHTVVAPVALIGLTLVYFDQRVRKEALDIQLLLEGMRDPSLPASTASAMAPAATEGIAAVE